MIVEPQKGTPQVETKLTGEVLWKLVNVTDDFQTPETIKRLCLYVLYSLTSASDLRYPSSSQDSGSSSLNIEKPRVDRRKRLVRQFSLWVTRHLRHFRFDNEDSLEILYLSYSNHSDEDDLPEALAAISSQCSMVKSSSNSSLDKQVQPPIYPPVRLFLSPDQSVCVWERDNWVNCPFKLMTVGLLFLKEKSNFTHD